MCDESTKQNVRAFLDRPKNLLSEIRRVQSRIEGLRLSMYPSGIRYDTDRVMSSPSDPMPRYAAEVDELQDSLKALMREYSNAQDDICSAVLKAGMTNMEQDVIMLRHVAFYSWTRIAAEESRSIRWMTKVHKMAVRKLEKYFISS